MKYNSNDIQYYTNTPCSFGWAGGGAKVVDHPVYYIFLQLVYTTVPTFIEIADYILKIFHNLIPHLNWSLMLWI